MRKANLNRHPVSMVESLESRTLYSAAAPVATAQVELLSTSGKGVHAVYDYEVTLNDTGTTPIGTLWFAWVPGEDFMKTSPLSVTDPAGWNGKITGGGSQDGFAIQWVATGTGVAAGQSLSGFEFTSSDSPAELAGSSLFHPTSAVETSVVYSGAPFSDSGFQFVGSGPTVAPKPPKNSLLAKLPATPTITASTVPANGDVNPYGVAIVPSGFARGGTIQTGDVLVSNFNSVSGLQGTGTTIVAVSPSGVQSTFYQAPLGAGLTTALGVLRSGFVLVGNVPAPDGAHVQGPGSLLVLDKNGQLVDTLTDPNLLDGPWDLTVVDGEKSANVFVSNVLNGTVTRVKLAVSTRTDSVKVMSETQIASGYTFRTDPAALVVGPTGLAFDPGNENLFVASTGDNAIYAIPAAVSRRSSIVRGRVVYQDASHLRGPLALALVGSTLITANGDAINADPTGLQNSELVEFTPSGKFVDQFQIDPTLGGAFGLAFAKVRGHTVFAAIDDVTNTLDEWVL